MLVNFGAFMLSQTLIADAPPNTANSWLFYLVFRLFNAGIVGHAMLFQHRVACSNASGLPYSVGGGRGVDGCAMASASTAGLPLLTGLEGAWPLTAAPLIGGFDPLIFAAGSTSLSVLISNTGGTKEG